MLKEEEKDIEEFDHSIRSVFEDAQEEVPSRVWLRVSSRLEGAAFAWRRAAYALAAAAAVAAAIFFIGTADRSGAARIEPVAVVETESSTGSGALAQVLPGEKEGSEDAAGNASDILPVAGYEAAPENGKGSSTLRNGNNAQDGSSAVRTGSLESGNNAQVGDSSVRTGDNLQDGGSAAEMNENSGAAANGTAGRLADGGEVREDAASATAASNGTHSGDNPADGGESGGLAEDVWTDPFDEPEPRSTRSAGSPSLYLQGTMSGNDTDLVSGAVTRSRVNGFRDPSTSRNGIVEKSISVYGIPVSVGAGISFPLSEKVSIGAGLSWSMLARTFQGTYTELAGDGSVARSFDADVTHTMHYLGIPLNIYYNILSNKTLKFYAWGGATAEYAVSNKYHVDNLPENITLSTPVKGMQLSVGFGAGVEFALSRRIGLYFDPSARYYLPCNQPKNIRTDRSLLVDFEAGLRFNL